jgi:hypothetical protein
MSIMDQVKKNLREWYSLAADRTGEMAKISVRMYDKYGISREIERQLSELGSYVYHAVEQGRADFAGDTEFDGLIERIQGLERDLQAKMEEIEAIRIARQQKQAERDFGEDGFDSDDDAGVVEVPAVEAGPAPAQGAIAAGGQDDDEPVVQRPVDYAPPANEETAEDAGEDADEGREKI